MNTPLSDRKRRRAAAGCARNRRTGETGMLIAVGARSQMIVAL
jgi:hypothetical protein